MSLIIYPTEDYDSFVSILDADSYIQSYSVQSLGWIALTDEQKEVYLRIATKRILDIVDIDLLFDTNDCIARSCSLMAIHDLVYEISSSVNPNTGVVSKEKVGDLEVNYYHGNTQSRVMGRNTNPFPSSVKTCLNDLGAHLNVSGINRATIVRS